MNVGICKSTLLSVYIKSSSSINFIKLYKIRQSTNLGTCKTICVILTRMQLYILLLLTYIYKYINTSKGRCVYININLYSCKSRI